MIKEILALILIGIVPDTRQLAAVKYKEDASNCQYVDVSEYNIKTKTILLNKDIVESFISILDELKRKGLLEEIESFDGSYNNRNVRGSNYKSAHAYCLALDFNARSTKKWSNEFIQVWIDHGWGWGGNFTTTRDDMHFTAAPWEGAGILKTRECKETRIVNKTKRPWEDRDTKVMESAKTRCKERYYPNECLVEFRRFDNYHYHAICGRTIEK